MFPSFLITFREVLEASLIVATMLGIVSKINTPSLRKTIWLATISAGIASIGILTLGSLFGFAVSEFYKGRIEEIIEGILMIASSCFITWAVFFLHTLFAPYKTHLLSKIQNTVRSQETNAVFILVFTAVLREGFEITLFLSTVVFSSTPSHVFIGFSSGILLALFVSYGLFKTAMRLPVYTLFRTTSALLILFSAGLLARGVHEIIESTQIKHIREITLPLIPNAESVAGSIMHSIFGIRQSMDVVQLSFYCLYTGMMIWWVFIRKPSLSE